MLLRIHVLLALAAIAGCNRPTMPSVEVAAIPVAQTRPPHVPDGAAGKLLVRAMDAAGGWQRWSERDDVSFISTFTALDERGAATSETIFLHKMLLHSGPKTRLESIGLDEELAFGLNGADWWMLRSGHLLTDERSTAFTRFQALSADYWFQVPFVFAEIPARLSYLGAESDGAKHWEKLRVEYDEQTIVPVNWVVAYIDVDSGTIDRIFCETRTELLRQKLWRAELEDFRTVDGIRRERRRNFFPVNDIDRLLGTKAAQQIIEHIQFDNELSAELFERPPITDGVRTAT